MPCWVAPAVAAEMWGMPVEHVMARVAEGSIATKVDAGFLFVDLLPQSSPSLAPAVQHAPATPPPSTFMSVSDAELAALAEPVSTPLKVRTAVRYAEDEEGGGQPFVDEETPDFSAKDWRRVRAQTARLRKPPAAAVVGAA